MKKVSLEKFVHRINERLPEGKNKITRGQLSDYRNGNKSPSTEVDVLMVEIMGEEAGFRYPWEEKVVKPLREENRELKDMILHLKPGIFSFSHRRAAWKTARALIMGLYITITVLAVIYRGPVLDFLVQNRYKDERYERKIRDLEGQIFEDKKLIASLYNKIDVLEDKLLLRIDDLMKLDDLTIDVGEKLGIDEAK